MDAAQLIALSLLKVQMLLHCIQTENHPDERLSFASAAVNTCDWQEIKQETGNSFMQNCYSIVFHNFFI